MEKDDDYDEYDDRRYDGMLTVDQWIMGVQIVLMLWIGVYIFSPVSSGGAAEYGGSALRICPRPEICSEGWIEIGLILASRLTAQFMLVPLVVVFLTKARIAAQKVNGTIVSLILPLEDLHKVHEKAGSHIAVAGTIHTLCHVARWIKRGDSRLFLQHPAGVSGVIAAVCLFPVVGLQLKGIKDKVSFEARKYSHFIFGVGFGVALLWHTWLLFVVLLIALAVYGMDFVYTTFVATHRIEHSEFTRLGSGVQLTFKEPPGWPQDAEGYVNVLVPWISRTQLHPYSMYKSIRPGYACVFILSSGDWTRALHASIARDTKRPVWIQGPFPSPYGEHAANFDNMLLVSTGIGITPAISSIQKFARTGRSVALIWSCRDPSLISFYVFQLSVFDDCALTLIFYTGKQPLDLHKQLPPHIRIVPSRPDLVRVVPDVIHCVEQNIALPASLQGKAATFLLEMNDVYAGIHATATARLRFDAIILNCLKRGASQDDIVGFFFSPENVVGAVAPGAASSSIRTTSMVVAWRDALQRHSFSSNPILPTTMPPSEPQPSELFLDDTSFGQAYAALATTMTSVTPDVVADILLSISGTPTGVTRDDLDAAVGALVPVKNELLENESAARKLDATRKHSRSSSMRRILSLGDLEAGPRNDDNVSDAEMGLRRILPPKSTDDLLGIAPDASSHSSSSSASNSESPRPHPDLAVARQFHKRWALMYCGGSTAVLHTLKDISRDLDIQLSVDRFDW